MKRFYLSGAVVLIALLSAGCAQKGAQQEIMYKKFIGPDRVLVLLLPPISGDGSHYEQYGFIEAVRERGFETDLKILDVDPILYLQGRISEVIKTELVDPAKAAGYNRILLVGISLGGHGALLYATQHPQDVDGVVVLAPFLGGLFIDDVIKEAGGLDKWEKCPRIEWDYACDMWKLLKDYLATQENRDKIIIGYGLEDGFASSNKLLADQLPATNVFAEPGGHDWVTWKHLWIDVLDYFHTSCSASGSQACLIEVKKVSEAELD